MSNKIPVDIALEYYNTLLNIKVPENKLDYPYNFMEEGEVIKTLKQIELVYQHLSPQGPVFKDKNYKKKGGIVKHPITVLLL